MNDVLNHHDGYLNRAMKKKTCALISVMKNEAIMLPLWLEYYLRHFDAQDIFVGDDGSTDGTTQILAKAGINVIDPKFSPSGTKHVDLVNFAKAQARELLEHYDSVLYAEIDEFMVPFKDDLRTHIENWVSAIHACCPDKSHCKPHHQYQVVYDLDVIHDVDNEEPWDMSRPLMSQRKYAIHVPKFSNAMLWSCTPRWSGTFHRVDDERKEPSNTLYMVHIHHGDFGMCNARHKARNPGIDVKIYNSDVDDELRDFFKLKFNEPEKCYTRSHRLELPAVVYEAFSYQNSSRCLTTDVLSSSDFINECVAAVRATGNFQAEECIKLMQECSDVSQLVLPVSMLPLAPVVQQAIKKSNTL